MTSMSLAIGHPTLVDRVFGRGLIVDGVLVAAGAALTAIAAQLQLPLWPVPVTAQTLAVMLVGSALGALRGAMSMVLYAIMGVFGLPVFSDGQSGAAMLTGRTGGYILGFIATAAFTGWAAQRALDRTLPRILIVLVIGTMLTFAIGVPWLGLELGLSVQQSLNAGFLPFIIGGTMKICLASAIITFAWKQVEKEDRRAADAQLAG